MLFKQLLLAISFLTPLLIYAGNNVTLSSAPSMSYAREGHEAKVLNDGRVIVFGGDDGVWSNMTSYSNTEIFNPKTNSWLAGPSMNVERRNHQSVVLDNGKILTAGGINSVGATLNSCEIFDPELNTWTYTGSSLMYHTNGALIKLRDGRVLYAGGNSKKVEIYEPVTEKWSFVSEMNDLHGEGMSLNIFSSSGNVVAVGGMSSPKSVEVFYPTEMVWVRRSSLTHDRYYHGSAVLSNGTILITGSSSGSASDQLACEMITPSFNGSGSMNPSVKSDLLINSSYDKIIPLENGDALIYGRGDAFNGLNSQAIQYYNKQSNTWETEPNLAIGATDYEAVRLHDGRILLIGGITSLGLGANKSCLFVGIDEFSSCSNPNLDFQLGSSSFCYGDSVKLNINVEANTETSFLLGGKVIGTETNSNDETKEIVFRPRYFTPGENEILVSVKKYGCPSIISGSVFTANVNILNEDTPEIIATDNNTVLCPNEEVNLRIVSKTEGTKKYIWGDSFSSVVGYNNSKKKRKAFITGQTVDEDGCWSQRSKFISIEINDTIPEAGEDMTVCLTTPGIQMEGFSPVSKGYWLGSAVDSSGFFKPNKGAGTYYVKYEKCYGSSDYKKITVQNLNTFSFDSTLIDWGTETGTVCEELYSKESVTYPYVNAQITLDTNGVFAQKSWSGGLDYDYSTRGIDSINFSFTIVPSNSSSACPADSSNTITVNKTIHVARIPNSDGIEFSNADTACKDNLFTVTIDNPQKGVYYRLFISDAGEFYYSDGSPNLKVSHYYPETNNSYKAHLQAVSDEACDYKTIGRTEYLEPIELNIDFDLDKIKYLNTPVNTTNNSNADTYIWDINGVKSFGFEAASISYSEVNDYQYKLIGQSKYGCSDSVEKSIKVLKKAPGFPSDHSICQQGPIASKVNLGFNAYKSHIDNNGNLYVVGSNYSNTGGDYSGSMNWFVEKFSEDGTQIWKKEQSVLNYPPYYDFHSTSINGITSDSEGNIYLTGNYTASKLTIDSYTTTGLVYNKIFVMKLNTNGEMQWFIRSENDSKNDYGSNERAGTDIIFVDGNLYVSVIASQDLVSSEGQTFKVAEETLGASIFKIATNGQILEEYPFYENQTNFMYKPGIEGTIPHISSYYYTKKAVHTSPVLQDLGDGKIGVFGFMKGETRIGQTVLNADSSMYHTGFGAASKRQLTKEFNAILDIESGFVSAESHDGVIGDVLGIANDLKRPFAAFDVHGNYISAFSVGNNANLASSNYAATIFKQNGDTVNIGKNKNFTYLKSAKNGAENWNKILENVTVRSFHYLKESNKIALYGSFLGGLSFKYSSEDLGLQGTGDKDGFVMLIDAENGKLIWVEKVHSSNIDHCVISAISNCGDMVVIGKQKKIYGGSYPNVKFQDVTISNVNDGEYMIKFPMLSQSCNDPGSCKITVSNDDVKEDPMIDVFPNPTNSIIYVSGLKSTSLFHMFDTKGILVMQGYTYNSIDLSHLSNGVYHLKINNENFKVLKRN